MTTSNATYRRWLQWLFAGFCGLLIAAAADNTLNHQWRLSADMAHMIDTGETRSLASQWNTRSAQQFENQLVLVLRGTPNDQDYDREDDVANILNAFEQRNQALLVPLDHSETLRQLTRTLLDFRFNLLNPQLQTLSSTQIQERLVAQAYSNSVSPLPGLDPISDPLQSVQQRLQHFLPNAPTDFFADHIALVHDDDSLNVVLAYQLLSSGLDLKTQAQVVKQVDLLTQALKTALPDFRLLRLGPVFHAQFAAASMKSDLTTIATGSSIGILLLFITVFARPAPLLVSLTGIGFGFLAAFIVCNWLFAQLHFIVLVFGATLIGVAVDFSLHFFTRYSQSQSTGIAVFRHLSAPLTLSLTSSVLGYLCLSLSGLSSLLQIAVFSATGLAAAWLFLAVAACRLPAAARPAPILRLIDNRLSSLTGQGRVFRKVLHRSLALVVTAASLSLAFHFQTSDDPRLMYHSSPQLIADLREAAEVLQDYDASRAILVEGQTEQDVLQKLADLEPVLERWQRDGIFEDYRSIRALLPTENEQRANFARNQELYAGPVRTAMEQLGVPLAQQQQNSPLNREFTPLAAGTLADASALVQPLWFASEHTTAAVIELRHPQTLLLQEAIQQLNRPWVHYADRAAEISTILATIRHKAERLLLVSYGLILLIFLSYYRSLAALKLVALPLGCSLVTLAVLSLSGGINAFHIFALYLILGLGIDYAVFLQASRASASSATLTAILLAATTSLLSFGLLGLSDTPMIGDFGLTLSLGISLCTCVVIGQFSLLRRPTDSP